MNHYAPCGNFDFKLPPRQNWDFRAEYANNYPGGRPSFQPRNIDRRGFLRPARLQETTSREHRFLQNLEGVFSRYGPSQNFDGITRVEAEPGGVSARRSIFR